MKTFDAGDRLSYGVTRAFPAGAFENLVTFSERFTPGHASVETTGKYLHVRPDRSTSDYLPG